jgi:hypothetical protein
MRIAAILIVAVSTFFIAESAYAWGPSAHLSFGLELIDRLTLLPRGLQTLISVFQPQFLYGSISADITLGKKYFIDYRHHCHNWQVGMELLERAEKDSLRAFVLGYLCHLAADTVAHNLYVPLKTVHAYQNPGKGHLYWELVFDRHLIDQRILDMFYSLSRNPFAEEDAYLQASLKPTLFSFATNKRIFNGLLVLQRLNRWQVLMEKAVARNTDGLNEQEVGFYRESSINAMLSFLIDRQQSQYFRLDPTGDLALEKSKVCAKALRKGKADISVQHTIEKIEQHFSQQLAGA